VKYGDIDIDLQTLKCTGSHTRRVKISRPTLTRYNFDKGGPIFINS